MPPEGRKVQCGSCSQVWFYTPPPIQFVEEEIIVEQDVLQQPLDAPEPKTEDKFHQEVIDSKEDVKVVRVDKNYSLRMNIYLIFFLLLFSSIMLLPFKKKVVMVFPFLKGYLDILTEVILKLFTIFNII